MYKHTIMYWCEKIYIHRFISNLDFNLLCMSFNVTELLYLMQCWHLLSIVVIFICHHCSHIYSCVASDNTVYCIHSTSLTCNCFHVQTVCGQEFVHTPFAFKPGNAMLYHAIKPGLQYFSNGKNLIWNVYCQFIIIYCMLCMQNPSLLTKPPSLMHNQLWALLLELILPDGWLY